MVRVAASIAAEFANGVGLEVIPFPADWDAHGKAAGPIRNTQMLTEGKPDYVIAFFPDRELRGGTGDMVRKAQAAALPVRIIRGTW